MEKLKMHSTNAVNSNIDALEQLFPDCITESIDENGQTVKAVDFDKLKASLSYKVVEGTDERYNFTWPQKSDAIRLANSRTSMTLRPCREESLDFDNTGNLYIEGDNLDVLKVLRNTYRSRVKMIYIDPPYNTGNDFVYEDDFSIDTNDYLLQSNQHDENGNRLVINQETNGRFHTDWLNMIYPRLKVARDLLRDDGVIFISIDDNEVDNLKKICSEIMGESNFIGNLIWQSRASISNDRPISWNHNHTLVYAKSASSLKFRGDDLNQEEYTNPDNDPRGPWKLVPIDANHLGGQTIYPIKNPFTGKEYFPPKGRCWSYNEATTLELIKDGRIKFGLKDDSSPKRKLFLNERLAKGDSKTPSSILQDLGCTKDGTNEVSKLFNNTKVFDYPKPTSFIERMIKYGAVEDDDIVMDFFSGSASTAHGLLLYNIRNNKKGKYILVQVQEEILSDNRASKRTDKRNAAAAVLSELGRKAVITEIGKERIRRAGTQIKSEFGDLATDLDVGFRVLKLDSSNMEDVFYLPQEMRLESLITDNIKPDRTSEDLLFQTMLETDVLLSSSISVEHINNKEVFVVRDGYLMACLDEHIDLATVKAIAERKPAYFITRDGSMASDDVADNMEQIFMAISANTTIKVL